MSTQTQPLPLRLLFFISVAVLGGAIAYKLLTYLQQSGMGNAPGWWALLLGIGMPVAVIVGIAVYLYLTKNSR